MVVNSARPDAETIQRYKKEGAELVRHDAGLKKLGLRIAEADLIEDAPATQVLWEKQDFLRHHPDKLGDALCRLYANMELYGP